MEGQYNSRNPAVKRLFREAQELAQNPDEDFHAAPLEDNLFEWHFTIRGPVETPFENGLYHGRIILPADYPMKPPNIIILTPNGRFETNTKICLSISGYHPETWQPSWSIRTALKALIGFLPTPGSGAIGSLDLPDAQRQVLAQCSRTWACSECKKANLVLISSTETLREATAEIPSGIKPTEINPFAGIKEAPGSQLPSNAHLDQESASGGDGPVTDFTFPPLPPRPRTSSLQSRPGRGNGKRAHFQDDVSVVSSENPAAGPTVEDYSFPPRMPSVSREVPVASTENSGATPSLNVSTEDMKRRQSLILKERRKVLTDRLASAERTRLTGASPESSFAITDPDRLERMINHLRQTVLLVLLCLIFLILRRVILALDEDEYHDM